MNSPKNNAAKRGDIIDVVEVQPVSKLDKQLAEQTLIFKTSLADDKIYIREQSGVYQRIRRYMGFALMALFVLVPFIQFNGQQAIFFDVAQQKFHFFFITLFPQDLMIFCLIFMVAAFALFYVTKFYGRVWCGFTCPQTIWMLMFNWLERRIEGTHNQSRQLDQQALSWQKVVKKTAKHSTWLALSLATGLVFMSYFIPVTELYPNFLTGSSSGLVVSWVVFFAACTYINGGWIREKMCQHMCPYSRFQSAMFDGATKLVTYNNARGEHRGKRKRKQAKPSGMGDCVDCDLCVQVCPVGIDIRDGLQYECINCGLCIDACDSTMDKFGYQRGLIDFSQEQVPENGWKRHIGYGSFVGMIVIAMAVWALTWQSFEVNILRDRQVFYRINENGHVENTFLFKVRNKSDQIRRYQVAISGVETANIVSKNVIEVAPGELSSASIIVETANAPLAKRTDVEFAITDTLSGEQLTKQSSFYSGAGSW